MRVGIWKADRRLYLDRAGKVVEATDPTRAMLLVPEGGTLPMDRALDLGLVKAAMTGEPAEEVQATEVNYAEVDEVKALIAAAVKTKEDEIETLNQKIADLEKTPAETAAVTSEKDGDKKDKVDAKDKAVQPSSNK